MVSVPVDPCPTELPAIDCFTAIPEKRILGVVSSPAAKTKLFAVGPAI
jgi:hypothetical protein